MKERIPSIRKQNPLIPQSIENIVLKANKNAIFLNSTLLYNGKLLSIISFEYSFFLRYSLIC